MLIVIIGFARPLRRLQHAAADPGVSSLMILGLFDRLGINAAEEFDHVHGLVEATKRAFLKRNAHVGDPAHMTADPAAWLAVKPPGMPPGGGAAASR